MNLPLRLFSENMCLQISDVVCELLFVLIVPMAMKCICIIGKHIVSDKI